MAMMMFHEGQPYHTPPNALYGLYNQIKFLRETGAVSVQGTVYGPAVGTREQEATYAKAGVLRSVGSYVIPESRYDGNHVIIGTGEAAWKRQVKRIGGYAAFYNPANLVRALNRDGSPCAADVSAISWSGWLPWYGTAKMTPYILRLMTGKPSYKSDAEATTIDSASWPGFPAMANHVEKVKTDRLRTVLKSVVCPTLVPGPLGGFIASSIRKT